MFQQKKEPSRKRAEVLWANAKCNRNVKACEIQAREREKKKQMDNFTKPRGPKLNVRHANNERNYVSQESGREENSILDRKLKQIKKKNKRQNI